MREKLHIACTKAIRLTANFATEAVEVKKDNGIIFSKCRQDGKLPD